jgi:hypothetical protein
MRNPNDPNNLSAGAARVATIVKAIRKEAGEILFLHAADWLTTPDFAYSDRNSPGGYRFLTFNSSRFPVYGYRGLVDLEVFEKMGLDATTLGNHDFDIGLWWNYHLFRNASFDTLVSNVTLHPYGGGPAYEPYFTPYKIYRKNGFTVGVIGIETNDYKHEDQVEVTDAIDAIAPLAAELKNQCDLVVLLSHHGTGHVWNPLNDMPDRFIAEKVPDIDVIIGGHTHIIHTQPVLVGKTIICEAGPHTLNVGRLELDIADGGVRDYRYKLYPTDKSVREDPEIKALLDKRKVPVTLRYSLSVDGTGSHSLGNYLAEEVEKVFPSGAVMLSMKKYRAPGNPGALPEGPVSAKDFFALFWPMYLSAGPAGNKACSPATVHHLLQAGGDMGLYYKENLNYFSGAMTDLIRVPVPAEDAAAVSAGLENLLRSSPESYALKTRKAPVSGDYVLTLDLWAWIDLLEAGVLKFSYPFEDLDTEIPEVLIGLGKKK